MYYLWRWVCDYVILAELCHFVSSLGVFLVGSNQSGSWRSLLSAFPAIIISPMLIDYLKCVQSQLDRYLPGSDADQIVNCRSKKRVYTPEEIEFQLNGGNKPPVAERVCRHLLCGSDYCVYCLCLLFILLYRLGSFQRPHYHSARQPRESSDYAGLRLLWRVSA